MSWTNKFPYSNMHVLNLQWIIEQLQDNESAIEDLQNAIGTAGGLPVKNVLDPKYGAKGDGTTDDRDAIISALVGGGIVYFPKGEYRLDIDSGGLSIESDTIILFDKDASIKNLDHDKETYNMFYCADISNVTMINVKLDGNRTGNSASDGEYGHGFGLRGCSNIHMIDCVADNCWGDGVYIGTTTAQEYCENITIDNIVCDNNRRQGISLISGKKVEINNPTLTNTNGTSPAAGIDIEPNANTEHAENIRINNPNTKDNEGAGVKIFLNNLSDGGNTVDIVVEGHSDFGSVEPLKIDSWGGKLDGQITVENSTYVESSRQAVVITKELQHPRLTLLNPTIINPCVNGAGSSTFDNGISIFFTSGDTPSTPLGGIDIIGPVIYDDRDVPLMERAIYVDDQTDTVFEEDVNIIDIRRIDDNQDSDTPFWFKAANSNFKANGKNISKLNTSTTLGPNNYSPEYSNGGFTSSRTYTMRGDLPAGIEYTFNVDEDGYYITINPAVDEIILPGGTAVDKYVRSNVAGSSLTLKKYSDTVWHIKRQVGTWEFEA